MLEALKAEAGRIGRPEWRPMLRYVAELHERSTHPPRPPFPYPWEEIGPGYCYGPAFGHWDLIHQVLDTLPAEPEHARHQLLNNLAAQEPDGLVPGTIWMRGESPRWSKTVGHPGVWPLAVQDLADLTGSDELIARCYEPLARQLGWFERNRQAEGIGFFYSDILGQSWESGIDEGVRFEGAPRGPYASVDATAHVYAMYEMAARWARALGRDPGPHQAKADALGAFLRDELYDPAAGYFYDIWSRRNPALRHVAFEGMFPMVMGAATPEQANRVIDEHLLNPEELFAPHPLCTVGLRDPLFELRMWRGPTWNSMTYWAARGCLRYGRPDAARQLAEAALDACARQFQRTGAVWEFYHPLGEDPRGMVRKHGREQQGPCPDYLGHNPLLALARIWENT